MAEAVHLLGLPKKHKHSDLTDVGADDHHPRWDRILPPWQMIAIPYVPTDGWTKYGAVISPGVGVGAGLASVSNPSVIWVDGVFYMAFSGYIAPNFRIYVCKSTDGINWSDRVLAIDLGPAGAFDEDRAYIPNFMCDKLAAAPYRYKIWYTGYRAEEPPATQMRPGLAFSSSPLGPYTKYPNNPLSPPSRNTVGWDAGLATIRAGSLYYHAYITNTPTTHIHCCTSGDGVTFTDFGSILGLGATDEWDDYLLQYISIVWILGVWYLMYSGHDGTQWRIGMAMHNTGFGTYSKFVRNPILEDMVSVFYPCIMQHPVIGKEGQWLLWYRRDGAYDIRLATIP